MRADLKIVIPGDDPPMIAGSPHLARLDKLGEVTLYDTRPSCEDEQFERVKDAHVIINSRGHVKWSAASLRRLLQLEVMSLCSIGTDCVDLNAARELGITVCNVPGRTAKIVAEHAFALMFATSRRVAYSTADIKAGGWSGLLSKSLVGKTLGVIGTGNIGCQLIALARSVGMHVIAWTFNPTQQKADEFGFQYCELDELLQQSDVVSVNVKLTDDSRGMIGAKQFAMMKPGCIFVNTARAAVVDTVALVDALNSGHLMGAGIDVYDVEPSSADSPLMQCEHVVLTPHAADQVAEAIDMLNQGAVENVVNHYEGRPSNNVI